MTPVNPIARTRRILEDLEAVRENLLALSDDIWLSIDHNDGQALEAGVDFKRSYNAKVAAFDVVASELSALVQQYTSVSRHLKCGQDSTQNISNAVGRQVAFREQILAHAQCHAQLGWIRRKGVVSAVARKVWMAAQATKSGFVTLKHLPQD